MKNKTLILSIPVIASFTFFGCQDIDTLVNRSEQHTVHATLGHRATRVALSPDENSGDMITSWQDGDKIHMYLMKDAKYYDLGASPVRNISQNGKSCEFQYGTPEGLDLSDGYYLAGFTGPCDAVIKDGDVYYNASLLRMPISQFKDRVMFGQYVNEENLYASFTHYGAYEILHVKNASDKDITFSLCGYDATPRWYIENGAVRLSDKQIITDLSFERHDKSSAITIPAGQSDIIVSWYIPNGQKIQDAKLVAEIDGNYVHSSNTKSSNVTLCAGIAYHMYSSWDGTELNFTQNDNINVDGDVTVAQYQAAMEAIKENGNYYIYTLYNGENEGLVKYYLKSDGYLTANESEAHIFKFGHVTGSSLFITPGWKLDIPFSNPILSNGSTGDLPLHGHIRTDYANGFRNDWEGKVWYKRGERYAVRSTNAVSSEWGANTYWTVLDSNADAMPEADYSLTPKFIWQLEDYIEHLKLSSEELALRVGTSGYIDIISGTGPFTATCSEPSLAECAIEGRKIKISSVNSGTCSIQVTDEGSGDIAQINLTIVDNAIPKKQEFTVNGVSFSMIKVEGGTFNMGATSEQEAYATSVEYPVHKVSLTTYAIGETEVTQELWEAVMGTNPSSHKGASYPVENITWDECNDFITKLNTLTGYNFTLPTEAQWEFAARGGNHSFGYVYSGSNNLDDVAWYVGNSGGSTHTVGTKSPNELGLYDMSGNVFEYVRDRFNNYTELELLNPSYPDGGQIIDRGGSFIYDDWQGACRVSWRDNGQPVRANDVGFRIAF